MGTVVEASGDLGQVLGVVLCQVGALGQLLAQQAVGVRRQSLRRDTPTGSRWHSSSPVSTTISLTYTIAGMSATSHVMTVSRNGQVSIPAEARARWKARHVVVVDLGDRVVVRPLSERPTDDLRGKYSGRGPRTDRARAQARSEDAARARSR